MLTSGITLGCKTSSEARCQIYEGLFYQLLDKCKSVTPKYQFRFKNPLFSMDATIIDLCLSVFP